MHRVRTQTSWPALPPDDNPADGITDERLQEYKHIIFKAYGREISDSEAREQIVRLRALYRAILGPIPEDPGDIPEKPVKAR